jgi:hypothetical protein
MDVALLHIALQEGFFNDIVIVRVDGREAFNKAGVSTKLQIGRAGAFDLELDPGPARVEVTLPGKGRSGTATIEVSHPTYLGVSVARDGSLAFQTSDRPFGYV